MTNKQLIQLSISATLLMSALVVVSPVGADGCVTQYGNGQYGQVNCPPTDLTIDKKVRNPITGEYKDNLLAGDAAYSPESTVLYSLKVTNSSNQTFTTVEVKDTVPDQMSQPQVIADDKALVTNESTVGNTLTFNLKTELKAGESREIRIEAKVKGPSSFDSKQNLHCDVTNKVIVTAQDRKDDDEAKLCVQTNILGKTTLPNAGPEDYLPLVPFVTMGIIGVALFLRKPALVG